MTRRVSRLFGAALVGGLTVGFLPSIASATPPEPPAVVSTTGFRANIPASYDPFADDNGDTFENDIEAVASLGIALGGPGGRPSNQFGPGLTVPRDQMASFIARTIDAEVRLDKPGSPTVTPLPAYSGTNRFTDVPATNPHVGNINRLAAAGIVLGTSGTTFAPSVIVTRGQVASFINRAQAFMNGQSTTGAGVTTGYIAPSGANYFTDDNGSVHEANINGIASVGIYVGDGVDTASPNAGLPRNQMAGLLDRDLAVAFNAGTINAAPTPTVAGSGVTSRPELIGASVVSTVATGVLAGTTVAFTFDEAVTTPTPGNFTVVSSDGVTRTNGTSATVQSGGTVVNVLFPITSSTTAAALTVGTVVQNAVVDTTGAPNPEGDAALGSATATPLPAGTTAAPDLTTVGNFRAATSTLTFVDFTFDQTATAAGGSYHLIALDGAQDITGTLDSGNGTTVHTIAFTNTALAGNTATLAATQFARGYDAAGTVTGSTGAANPKQAADVSNGGNSGTPDLVSATFNLTATTAGGAAIDQATLVFDEPVSAGPAGTAGFQAYLASGATTANPTGAGFSTTTPTQVLLTFADGTLSNAVGVSINDGAVIAGTGAVIGASNQDDEVGVANTTSATTAGRTGAPDLVSVTKAAATDIFGTPTGGFNYTFNFDADVTAGTVPASFTFYDANGTRYLGATCTTLTSSEDTDNLVVCSAFTAPGGGAATATQSSTFVLGGVIAGAVTAETGGLTNPTGSSPVVTA